jgi:hypothetical protein
MTVGTVLIVRKNMTAWTVLVVRKRITKGHDTGKE